MDVWIVEWSYPNDVETEVSVWANEHDAYYHACEEIKSRIDGDWDMDDEDQQAAAEQFDNFFVPGGKNTILSMTKAIRVWDEYQSNFNDEYAQYWNVSKKSVRRLDEGDADTLPPPVMNYKASVAGATCRGPCGQFNDYAYADRSDGTHVCRQCSTFQHIFGVKS